MSMSCGEKLREFAADACLRLNGYRLANSDDLESFFWSIARGEQSVEDISTWVKNQAKQLINLIRM